MSALVHDPRDGHEFLKAQVLACLRRTQQAAREGAAKTRMVQQAASDAEERTGRFRKSDIACGGAPSQGAADEEKKVEDPK